MLWNHKTATVWNRALISLPFKMGDPNAVRLNLS
jgi:hypothetical protein